MILVDVNVLVYAFRREAVRHSRYAAWLNESLAGSQDMGLVDTVLAGFVRIVTNRRILADPAPTRVALDFVEGFIEAPRARWLQPSPRIWRELAAISAADRAVAGNRIPDAYLAAMALGHGCRLATADRGMARYPGLQWFDPGT